MVPRAHANKCFLFLDNLPIVYEIILGCLSWMNSFNLVCVYVCVSVIGQLSFIEGQAMKAMIKTFKTHCSLFTQAIKLVKENL